MDLNALFQSLQAADQSAQKENPFLPTQEVADQVGSLIVKNAGEYGTKDSAIASLLAGLVSGGSQNLGQSYRDKQNDLAFKVLSGELTERPSGMDPSIFSNLNNTRSLFQISQQSEAAAKREAKTEKFQEKLLEGAIENPYKAKKALQDPQVQELLAAAGIGVGSLAAPTEATESTTAAPATGQKSYEQLLDQTQGRETLADDLYKKQLDKPKESAERIAALRKEFSGLPEVQTYKLQDTGFKSMIRALKDPSGTSDVEITRAAIQAIEPGLAVRTDDQTAITQSASIPEAYKATMLRALSGGTGLSPDVRSGLYRIAARRYNASGSKFNELKNFYGGQAAVISPESKDLISPYGDFTAVNDLYGLPDGPATLEDAVGDLLPKLQAQTAPTAPTGGSDLISGLSSKLPAGSNIKFDPAGNYYSVTLPDGQTGLYKQIGNEIKRVK